MGRRDEILTQSWKEFCYKLDALDYDAWRVFMEYFPSEWAALRDRLTAVWDFADATLDSFEYFVNTFAQVYERAVKSDGRLDTFHALFPIVRQTGLDPHTATFGEVYSYLTLYGHSGQAIPTSQT